MQKVLLDGVENLVVEYTAHANEINTLKMLAHGLGKLARNIQHREEQYAEFAKKAVFSSFGATNDQEEADLNLVACFFHWFGVSVCNYARLVGFIRGLEKGEFTRADLKTAAAFSGISKAVKAYAESIPELAPVQLWRNKVAGHFAITDPRGDDNIATLNMSVMFPVTLENGMYYVGGLGLTQSGAWGTATSQLPKWSVTQVFESLIPRFWPDIRFERGQPPPATAPEANPA